MKAKRLVLSILAALLVACVSLEAGEGPGPLTQAISQMFGAPIEAAGATDGQVLTYDSTTGTWRAEAGASGATPDLDAVLEEGATASIAGGVSIASTGADIDLLAVSGEVYTNTNLRVAGNLSVESTALLGFAEVTDRLKWPAAIETAGGTVGSPTSVEARGLRFNNSGATAKVGLELPEAATGRHLYIDNVDSDGIRVTAATGDTIRLGDLTCASAGYFESVRVGSSIHLVAIDATQWVAVDGITGTWRADSTTSAGFAYTPLPPTAYTLSHSWDADVDVTENAATTFYTQVGSMLTWWGEIRFTGAPPNTTLAIKLPNSWSWQTNHDVASNGWAIVSDVTVYDNGVGALGHCRLQLTLSDRTTVTLMSGTTTLANSSATSPITWATGDAVWFRVTVPVN